MNAPPHGLRTVEAGRGIAAVLVVLFHASAGLFPAVKYWNVHPFGRIFDFGYSGVFFFFVLSGFIIAHVHRGDIGNPAALRRYALRRFTRIYPFYWLVLATVVTAAALPLGLGTPPSAATLLSSVLLVGPDATRTALKVVWTLYHEVAFYTVFGLWIVDRRIGAAVTVAWAALVVANLAGATLPAAVPTYIAAPVNLLFAMGVAAEHAARRMSLRAPWLVAAFATAAFIANGAEAVFTYPHRMPPDVSYLLFGAVAAVGLAAVVIGERRDGARVPPLLMTLGSASYAIYLTHLTLLSLLGQIAVRTGIRDSWPTGMAFVAVVAVAIAAGVAVHRLVERPLLAALRRALHTG